VAAFSDVNFEVKDWINKTFKSAEAQENRDVCPVFDVCWSVHHLDN